MNLNTSITRRTSRGLAAVGLAAALVLTTGGAGLAQSNNTVSGKGLRGTWFVRVTLRDCATNAPIGQPFSSLVTFHRGGTISESTNSRAFATGQRSDSPPRALP